MRVVATGARSPGGATVADCRPGGPGSGSGQQVSGARACPAAAPCVCSVQAGQRRGKREACSIQLAVISALREREREREIGRAHV